MCAAAPAAPRPEQVVAGPHCGLPGPPVLSPRLPGPLRAPRFGPCRGSTLAPRLLPFPSPAHRGRPPWSRPPRPHRPLPALCLLEVSPRVLDLARPGCRSCRSSLVHLPQTPLVPPGLAALMEPSPQTCSHWLLVLPVPPPGRHLPSSSCCLTFSRLFACLFTCRERKLHSAPSPWLGTCRSHFQPLVVSSQASLGQGRGGRGRESWSSLHLSTTF